MRLQDKRIIFGVDYDSADELIQNGYVRDMLNCMVTSIQGEDSVVTNLKGTKNIFDELGFSLPEGDNKCIGAYTSKNSTLLVWFNWNSNNQDGVYIYDGVSIRNLIAGDLDWEQDKSIHSIALVNNQLTWAEGVLKYPRSINITRSYDDISSFFISLPKVPPTYPLVIEQLYSDDNVDSNLFKNSNYYFTYRFVYKDGQQSIFAPYSKLVSSSYATTNETSRVRVYVNTNQLEGYATVNGVYYNSAISRIDFAISNTYLGPFKLINSVKVEDVIDANGWYNLQFTNKCLISDNGVLGIEFKNQTPTILIDSAIYSKPFDSVWPCESLTTVDNRIVIANTLEGFPDEPPVISNETQGWVTISDYNDIWGTVTTTIPSSRGGVVTTTKNVVIAPGPASKKGNFMAMKPKSKYGIGVVYYNEYGQKSGVYPIIDVNVPSDFGVTSLDEWTTSFKIESTPPDWATHYQIVRTDNQTCTRFVQGITNNVKFIKGYNGAGEPIEILKIIGQAFTKIESTDFFGNVNEVVAVIKQSGWGVQDDSILSYAYSGLIYEGGRTAEGEYLKVFTIKYNLLGNVKSIQANDSAAIGVTFATDPIGRQYLIGPGGVYANPSIPTPVTISGGSPSGGYATPPLTIIGKPIHSSIKVGLNNAVDIWIDIYNWNNNTFYEGKSNPSNETPYVFEKGDIVDVLYTDSGNYIGLLGMEIKDFVEGRYIVVKYQRDFFDYNIIGGGAFIEIWTPRDSSNQTFYYEYGECYPIINPKTPNRHHSKTEFSLYEGDTHRLTNQELYCRDGVYTYNIYSMNPSPRNRVGVWEKANGRPNLVLLDGNNKVRKVNTIRWSDKLVDGSKINGNSTFDEFNSIQLDLDFGPIRKVTGVEEVMIANCESESSVIYVNESLLKSADNEGIVAISNNVLNSPRKLPGGYGCIHPESVALYNNYLYWVSDNKGAAIRYNTVNGIFNISGGYKAKTYFYNKKPSWIGGFDPLFRMQLFCSDETIGFLDPADPDTPNAWTGRYSFIPERLGYLGLDLLSFKDGVLWKHHSSDVYNNFYGQQYQSEITPIFNLQPSDIKVFNSASIEASDSFIGEISTLEGQSSRILEMEKINQEWWSDILRDENTGGLYEGDLITSHILKIKFIYNKISKFRLRFINLYSQISQLTNK